MKKLYLLIFLISFNFSNAQKNIFDVSRYGTVEEISKLYQGNPNIINVNDTNGHSPLTLACYHENEAIVSFLIDKVKNINGSSKYGTPLMAAVVKTNLEIIKILLQKKADTNIADTNGTTALHYATLFKQTEIATLLVQAGAKSNIKDNRGQTALDYATLNQNNELITLFKTNQL